jgi:hypothetical protein
LHRLFVKAVLFRYLYTVFILSETLISKTKNEQASVSAHNLNEPAYSEGSFTIHAECIEQIREAAIAMMAPSPSFARLALSI